MNLKFSLDLGKDSQTYYELLSEEDFDFRTKDIKVDVSKNDDAVQVDLECNSVLDLKIGTTAIIKSLEIIDKTLNI